MATMKAVRFHTYGDSGVLVYEDMPRPEAGEGEVLIRIHAAGINPLDWKVRDGRLKERMKHKLPLVPGWDVSGVVEAVAPDDTAFKIGDVVYGRLNFMGDGAYAEYVATAAQNLAIKPKTIDHIQAGSVPLAALTAWQGLFEVASLKSGQSILIHAAAGGVGHFAVQIAKWKKAKVIGTASAKNESFLRELGADEVIDYNTTKFEDVVKDVDIVLDTMAGDTRQRSWQVLKKGGILVATLGISPQETPEEKDVRSGGFLVRSDTDQLTQIATLIDDGHLKPTVSNVLPLEEAAKAHELSQTEHVQGKIVLKVAG
jgi:NADPH:quinone reductase-like Zn-dependent oxidoreductase